MLLALLLFTQVVITGPGCPPGQVAPFFRNGFLALDQTLNPDRSYVGQMGVPLSCEYPDPRGTGDILQRTTTGLAFWRKATNTPTFTNGRTHWALTSRGVVTWDTPSIDPPADARPNNLAVETHRILCEIAVEKDDQAYLRDYCPDLYP